MPLNGTVMETIPPHLHFIYGKTIHDIINSHDPPAFYANIMDIRAKHEEALIKNNATKITTSFLGTQECHHATLKTEPQLLPYYKAENYGPHTQIGHLSSCTVVPGGWVLPRQ